MDNTYTSPSIQAIDGDDQERGILIPTVAVAVAALAVYTAALWGAVAAWTVAGGINVAYHTNVAMKVNAITK